MSEPRKVAIAPLGKETIADTRAAIGGFDSWLRNVSDNHVSLADLQTVAGALPIVGNVIAAGDLLIDLYDISQKKTGGDFADWMSVGINGLGLVPAPGTAALRVSMRPVLGSVRQALKRGSKTVGPALIDVISSHILASEALALKTEKAVQSMLDVLGPVMDDVAKFVSKVIEQFTSFLTQLINGTLGKYRPVPASAAVGKGQFIRNPKKTLSSFFGAAGTFYRQAVTTVASKAASALLSDSVKARLTGLLKHLNTNIKPIIVGKIKDLANAKAQQSIASLLTLLLAALKKGKKKVVAGAVAAGKKTKVVAKKAQVVIEQVGAQIKAKLSPNSCKECKSRSPRSIGYALGDEVFSHADFSLGGVMPLVWLRTYNSRLSAYDQGDLGARWTTPYSTRFDVVTDESGTSLHYFDAEGRKLEYPLIEIGAHHQDRTEGLMLSRLEDDLLTITRGHELLEVYERRGKSYVLRLLKDRAGNSLNFSYDHANLLAQITLSNGGIARFERDSTGRVSRIISPASADNLQPRVLAEYVYNEYGDLLQARDEYGHARDYQYQNHLITRYTDRTGRGVNLEWDGHSATSKAIREYNDDGSDEIRLSWDENIRLTSVRNALGDETLYYFNSAGYTYRIVYPDHSEEWLFRDDNQNLIKHVHPDGSSDRFEYDDRDNLIEHIRPDDSRVELHYDAQDQLIQIVDPNGNEWLREYDAAGNLIKETDPLGYKTEYSYNQQGLPVLIKDAKGGSKKLAYTPTGQLSSYTDCSGFTSEWHYDGLGRLAKMQNAAGEATSYQYGSNGRLSAVILPDATEAKLQFDAEGRLLTHTDAADRITRYGYDKAGRPIARTDAMGQELIYRYDKLGRLITLQNENKAQYRFSYDAVGKVLEEVSFDGKISRYQYAEASSELLQVDEAGQITTLAYDNAGRMVERASGTSRERFKYDAFGRIYAARNQFSECRFQFDEVGNLIGETHDYRLFGQRQQYTWAHEYDALGNRIASIRPDGQRTDWLIYGSGHVHGVLWNGQEIASFERDNLHREVSRTLGNQLAATQQYDKMGRLTQQTLAGKTSQTRSYQYDAVGQLLGINDSRSGATSYRYDPVGRLIAAASPHSKETFAFDLASNIVDTSGGIAAQTNSNNLPSNIPAIIGNLLKEYAGTHFKYDERGNLIEKQQGAQVQKLAWDGFNRLAALETPTGKTEYAYDVFGRRIAKRHNGQTTTFVWDGDVITLEKTAEQTRHYLFEAGSFVPLAQVVEKDGTANTAYYHVDHLGTPQLLTDADGEIAWQAEYKAWGAAKAAISDAAQSAGIDNPLRFQGQYFDPESGLHYNRHRYYDPETGRFISSDPIGLLGGLNTHAYAPNPVEWIDPLGLSNKYRRSNGQYGKKPGPKPKKTTDDSHGNSLCSTKPAVGYELVDRDTDEVVKYGETTSPIPSQRYSKKEYDEMNADMVIVKRGTKCEMHKWQHEKILEYKAKNNGARPKYNYNDY